MILCSALMHVHTLLPQYTTGGNELDLYLIMDLLQQRVWISLNLFVKTEK